jgi:ADP-ribose pyrophosphatase
VKATESRTLYNKHGRLVVLDTLEFADGSREEYVYFSGWGSPNAAAGAVAVAAFTKDNKIILTKQYRHPLGMMINDLPAGGIHVGETPKQAALRELEEETGYTTDKLTWIGRFNWNPSNMAGTVEIFFTKTLKHKGKPDPQEIARIEHVDFNKVLDRVKKGKYIDSALIIAALLVANKKLLHHHV